MQHPITIMGRYIPISFHYNYNVIQKSTWGEKWEVWTYFKYRVDYQDNFQKWLIIWCVTKSKFHWLGPCEGIKLFGWSQCEVYLHCRYFWNICHPTYHFTQRKLLANRRGFSFSKEFLGLNKLFNSIEKAYMTSLTILKYYPFWGSSISMWRTQWKLINNWNYPRVYL